jgi:hypothetical protein
MAITPVIDHGQELATPEGQAIGFVDVPVHGFARDSTVATREVGAWRVRRDVRGEAIGRESARFMKCRATTTEQDRLESVGRWLRTETRTPMMERG